MDYSVKRTSTTGRINWMTAMNQLIPLTAGGVRWEVLPERSEQLLGPAGLRLDEWLQAGQAQIIKHGPNRTVYRVTLPGLRFYLKHNRLPDTRAWLRGLVRPAKARIEFRRAIAVAARDVPTIVPIALGERDTPSGPGDSFLITLSLDDAEPVNAFLESTLATFAPLRQVLVRQRIACKLGEMLARLHDAGIVHHDLHPGNLLVRLDANDQPSLYLIDLHAVRLGRPLCWRASRDNLVILNRWFVLRASRTDRLRFWRAYCRARPRILNPADGTPRANELALDLERRTWLSNLRFWRSRDQRCLEANRHYQPLHSPTAQGHAVRDFDPSILESFLTDPDAPFRQDGSKLLKDSRSSTVAELQLPINGVLRPVIYKRFRVTAWSDPLVTLLRRPAALRSWMFGQGLRERGLPSPRPLLVLHRHRGGLAYEGYLLTEKICDAQDLHQFMASLNAVASSERRVLLRRRIDQVAQLIRELHRRQLSHRDLKASNLLLTAKNGLWLIDLVGIVDYARLPRSRRVQNLARLHASFHRSDLLTRTDKLRFLRVYLQWGLFGKDGWKRWWQAIEQATQAKVRKNLRSGRPLT